MAEDDREPADRDDTVTTPAHEEERPLDALADAEERALERMLVMWRSCARVEVGHYGHDRRERMTETLYACLRVLEPAIRADARAASDARLAAIPSPHEQVAAAQASWDRHEERDAADGALGWGWDRSSWLAGYCAHIQDAHAEAEGRAVIPDLCAFVWPSGDVCNEPEGWFMHNPGFTIGHNFERAALSSDSDEVKTHE